MKTERKCWLSAINVKSHAHVARGGSMIFMLLLLLKVCLSDFIDLLNFTLLHFHLDIIDSLFIVIAVTRSKGFQKLSLENTVQIESPLATFDKSK